MTTNLIDRIVDEDYGRTRLQDEQFFASEDDTCHILELGLCIDCVDAGECFAERPLPLIRQIESRCTGDDPCDVHAPCPAHAELAAEFLAMPKTKAPSPQTDETEQREAKWFCQGIAPII